jgi:hypothetical protein
MLRTVSRAIAILATVRIEKFQVALNPTVRTEWLLE